MYSGSEFRKKKKRKIQALEYRHKNKNLKIQDRSLIKLYWSINY